MSWIEHKETLELLKHFTPSFLSFFPPPLKEQITMMRFLKGKCCDHFYHCKAKQTG